MDSSNPSKYSIEFFPPRTQVGESKLDTVHAQLSKLNPDFFSVTYGAGGSMLASNAWSPYAVTCLRV